MDERSIYLSVKKISRQMVIAASTYKYGKDSYFTLADLDEPDMIIAEKEIPEEYKTFFCEHNVAFVTQTEEMRLSENEQEGDVD